MALQDNFPILMASEEIFYGAYTSFKDPLHRLACQHCMFSSCIAAEQAFSAGVMGALTATSSLRLHAHLTNVQIEKEIDCTWVASQIHIAPIQSPPLDIQSVCGRALRPEETLLQQPKHAVSK